MTPNEVKLTWKWALLNSDAYDAFRAANLTEQQVTAIIGEKWGGEYGKYIRTDE